PVVPRAAGARGARAAARRGRAGRGPGPVAAGPGGGGGGALAGCQARLDPCADPDGPRANAFGTSGAGRAPAGGGRSPACSAGSPTEGREGLSAVLAPAGRGPLPRDALYRRGPARQPGSDPEGGPGSAGSVWRDGRRPPHPTLSPPGGRGQPNES